jgi:hypothetical protein
MTKQTVTMEPVKATDNTVKFQETLPEGDFLATRKWNGGVYVPKNVLREGGYTGGAIKVTIEAA